MSPTCAPSVQKNLLLLYMRWRHFLAQKVCLQMWAWYDLHPLTYQQVQRNPFGFQCSEPEGGSVYSERCVGDQHYVCVVNPDQQNPERVRGFPVEIDVEEGENDAGENIFDDDDLDSGAVPTTPPDQGSDREQAPKRPRDVADERVAPGPGDPNDPDDPDGEDSDDPNP